MGIYSEPLNSLRPVEGLEVSSADESAMWHWLTLQQYLWTRKTGCECGAEFIYYSKPLAAALNPMPEPPGTSHYSKMRCFCGRWMPILGRDPIMIAGVTK